jgi:EmrB/QacA subfamily drug resistance transporter
VVGTAMPRVIADLNGMQHYAWVTTAYLVASAASMPIWGKLSDAFGRRRFYLAGMILFLVGSALCGQSRSMLGLIAFRAVQGLGAGAMMPINQAVIGDLFPPAARAKWQGMMMGAMGFATMVGPVLGGWITDTIGWRWNFYVNLPVGAIALVFAIIALPGHTHVRKHVVDYVGAALIVTAALSLMLAFSWAGSEYAWSSSMIIGLLAFSAVVWTVFYFWEMRFEEPIVNPRLFRNSVYSATVIANSLFSAVAFGTVMFLPLFVQGAMGKTATSSGTILMPMLLTQVVVGMAWGWTLSRWGKYKAAVLFGLAMMSVGAYLLSRLAVDSSYSAPLAFTMLIGAGTGLTMSTFTVVAQNQYPAYRLGEVTATLQFCRVFGGTIGLAVYGSVLNSRFASTLSALLPERLEALASDPATAEQICNPQVLLSQSAEADLTQLFSAFGSEAQSLFAAFTDAVRHSLESALNSVFLIVTGLAVAAFLVSLFIREDPLRRTHSEAPGEEID